jgi:hypothetical protein
MCHLLYSRGDHEIAEGGRRRATRPGSTKIVVSACSSRAGPAMLAPTASSQALIDTGLVRIHHRRRRSACRSGNLPPAFHRQGRTPPCRVRPAADHRDAIVHHAHRDPVEQPAVGFPVGRLEGIADRLAGQPCIRDRRRVHSPCGSGRDRACRARRPGRSVRRRRRRFASSASVSSPTRIISAPSAAASIWSSRRLTVCTKSWRMSATTQPSAEVTPGKRGTNAEAEADLLDQGAGMQRAAAAEGHGRKFRRVVALLDRHQPDRAGHLGVGKLQDRFRRLSMDSPSGVATCVSMARRAASTSSRASLPPIGRSGLMRPSTTLASVTVGRSLPSP